MGPWLTHILVSALHCRFGEPTGPQCLSQHCLLSQVAGLGRGKGGGEGEALNICFDGGGGGVGGEEGGLQGGREAPLLFLFREQLILRRASSGGCWSLSGEMGRVRQPQTRPHSSQHACRGLWS